LGINWLRNTKRTPGRRLERNKRKDSPEKTRMQARKRATSDGIGRSVRGPGRRTRIKDQTSGREGFQFENRYPLPEGQMGKRLADFSNGNGR
jgi:hypothetical protein